MIIEISVAVIAFAFVVFIIYIISLIKALKATLGQVNQTLTEVRKHLDDTTGNVDRLSVDINNKMEALNPIFTAISNLGDYFEQKTKSLKLEAKISALKNEAAEEVEEKEDDAGNQVVSKVASILEIVGQSFRLWQDVHKRR